MANSQDFKVKNGLVVATTATIQSTTNSVSTTTGALQVVGGVGIGGNLYVGGTINGNITGTVIGTASTATNIAGGAANQIPYQSAAGATTFNSGLTFNGTTFTATNIVVPGTTASTSTTTGALQVRGGVGIGGGIYVGGSITATNITLTDSTGAIILPSTTKISFGTSFPTVIYGNSSQLQFQPGNAGVAVAINQSGTAATNSTTGALIVTGGAGIAGNLYVGGTINGNITGTVTGTASTATNIAGGAANQIPYQTAAGATTFNSGLTFNGTTFTATNIVVPGTTAASSTATGALQVVGGVGIGGGLFVGGAVTATSAITVGSGSTGLIFQPLVGGGYAAVYSTNITPSTTNYTFATDGASPNFNGTYGVYFNISNVNKLQVTANNLNITPTAPTSSTSTGALTVAGGVGIGGGLFVGGTVTATLHVGNLTGTATTATNIAGGALGSIPYQTAAGTTAFIPIGTNGYVLTAGASTATWSAVSSLSAGSATTATNIAGGAANQIPYQSGAGATTFSNNLTFNGTTLTANLATIAGYNVRTSGTADLSALSTTTFYPVAFGLESTRTATRIRIQVGLNSNKPAWATHPNGFSIVLDWSANGSGWGVIGVSRVIHNYNEAWTNQLICGGITQFTQSSNEVVYLRGGGIYFWETDGAAGLTANIITASTVVSGQTIAPTATAVNVPYTAGSGYAGFGSVNTYTLDARSGSLATTMNLNSTVTTAYSPTSYNGGSARVLLYGGNATNSFTGLQFTHGASFEAFFGAVQNSSGLADFVFQGYNGSAYAERMRLDSSGNLGLGVTPSAWFSNRKAFDIGGSVSTVTGANITIFGNNYYTDTGGTNRYVTTGAAAQQMLFPQAGGVQWYNAPLGTAGNAITFTQAMTLDASGNLLVGETSAKYSAANRGLIEVNGTSSALLGLSVNNTAAGYLYSTGVNLYVGAPTGYNILFDINGEKMRIDSSGNLGIGTSSPGSTLDVRFATNPIVDNGVGLNAIRSYVTAALAADIGGAVTFGGTASSGGALASFGQIAGRKENATSANYAGYLQFVTNNSSGTMSERMRLDSSGNLLVGATSNSASNRMFAYGTGGTTIRVGDSDNTQFRGFVMGATAADSSEYGYLKLNANTGELRLYVGPNAYGGFQTFYTSGSERVRLDTSGNLLVGYTTQQSGAKLEVNGGVYVNGVVTATTFVGNITGTMTGTATTANNIAGGAANQIPYQSGAGATTFSSNLTWNGTTLYVNGRLQNAGGLKTYSVSTVGQGNTNSVHEIMKISRDNLNWSNNTPYEITVYSSYYTSGGCTKWLLSYGYYEAGTLTCTYAGGGGMLRVYLGTEVTVSANLQYRPVFVDLPPYMQASIEVRYSTTEVGSVGAINASSQVFFSNITTASGGTGSFYSGGINYLTSLTANTIVSKIAQDYVVSVTANSATTTLDLSQGNTFYVTMSASTTFAFSNVPTGSNLTNFSIITYNSAGGYAISWPASVTWAGAQTPARTTTSGKSDIYTFFTLNAGTNIIGSLSILNY